MISCSLPLRGISQPCTLTPRLRAAALNPDHPKRKTSTSREITRYYTTVAQTDSVAPQNVLL
jgi:hypothetical protein